MRIRKISEQFVQVQKVMTHRISFLVCCSKKFLGVQGGRIVVLTTTTTTATTMGLKFRKNRDLVANRLTQESFHFLRR